MKKMLKRIVVMALAVTVLLMPATSVLAETIPVCTGYESYGASYEYQPGPYILNANHGISLHNYMNPTQKWDVKAGEKFIFAVFFNQYLCPMSGKLIITDENGNTVASNQFTATANNNSCQINLPPLATDKSYSVALIAFTDMYIDNYIYFHIQ